MIVSQKFVAEGITGKCCKRLLAQERRTNLPIYGQRTFTNPNKQHLIDKRSSAKNSVCAWRSFQCTPMFQILHFAAPVGF